MAEVEVARREVQARHQQQYEEALVTVKEELRRLEAVQMREDMQDEIRAWMMAEWSVTRRDRVSRGGDRAARVTEDNQRTYPVTALGNRITVV